MYIKITDSTFKIYKTNNILEPIELNLKEENKKDELFETIKLFNGEFFNLTYHQKRVDFSYKNLFNTESKIDLKKILINSPKSGLYRAKVIYNKDGLADINYYIYRKKEIKKIALVELKEFDYSYKYLDRAIFDKLFKIVDGFDEFIILQDGYLKDTTIANIAFEDKNGVWVTPAKPLLYGTTLRRYLDDKKLIKKMIHYANLNSYARLATLNAMVDFNILKG
jgi:4-amino-4-deoxychorismate lyase